MTFTHYFGLSNNPFDMANDASFLSVDTIESDICQLILHDLRDGFSPIVLTGEPGSGKTQLLRQLCSLLPPDIAPITPINSCMNYLERVQMSIDLQDKNLYRAKKILLIVDDAQDIPVADLKLLLTIPLRYENTEKSFQMIWSGTHALDDKLSIINSTQFNSLDRKYYRLVGLNEGQVKSFIDECLKHAGYCSEKQRGIFSSSAFREIARLSKGLPRLINQLCSASLSLAYLDLKYKVDGQLVQEAASFCLLQPDKFRATAGQNKTLALEDILRLSQNKLSIKYIKRCVHFYWLKALSLNKNQILGKYLFSHKDTKVYAGGILASGICLLLLMSFLNADKQEIQPDTISSADTLIEKLPATSAGNTVTAPVGKKPGIESPVKLDVNKPLATSVSPIGNTLKNNVDPIHGNVNSAAQQMDIGEIDKPTLSKNPPLLNSKPDLKIVTNGLQGIMRQSSPRGNHAKLLSNRHSQVRVDNVKRPFHKAITEPKPEFVLMPLDAPGNWDEIVMLGDPKAAKNPPVEIPLVVPDETKPQGFKAKGVAKHQPKAKFVLKPIDAPGKWDEIILVADPKITQKNVGDITPRNATVLTPDNQQNNAPEAVIFNQKTDLSPNAAGVKKASAPVKSENLLHLDKSSYEYNEQIVVVDVPKPHRKPRRKKHR